jgi:4-amino-4-deoxychorismate lyase
MISILNGKITNNINIANRSLQFGDGVFETCKVVDSKIVLWQYHLERLQKGLKVLQINLNLDDLLSDLSLILPQIQNGGLKIIMSRGEGLQGYGYDNMNAQRILYSFDIPNKKDDITLNFCKSGYYSNPHLAGIKHQNRLEQILARGSGDDCIMLDKQDTIISTTSANIFMVQNNNIYTPSLDNCGILGTRRQYLIDNLDIKVKDIHREELSTADEVFITNATFGITLVKNIKSVENINFNHIVSKKLQDKFKL